MTLIVILGIPVLLILIVAMAQFVLSKKMSDTFMRAGSIESGFEALKMKMSTGTPFLFLAMLFVLFDLELVILIPGIFFTLKTSSECSLWLIIMSLILVTLVLEWTWCGLKWHF